jgi:uncharacterized protein
MVQLVLKGHKVSKGKASGTALVSRAPISFMGGVNPKTGVVLERGHELEGKCVADTILVFPTGKGSTAGSYQLYELTIWGKGPRAILNVRADSIVVVGAILGNIPMVDRLDQDPTEVIKTGDHVEVDAGLGEVRIQK